MFKSAKREQGLIEAYISAKNPPEVNKSKDDLMNYWDVFYRKDIERIIRGRFVLKNDDAHEASKDLYSSAIEIFLRKMDTDRLFLRELNYQAYILGIARNLFLERTRKEKEIPVASIPDYQIIDEELSLERPLESEVVQNKVESALVSYFIDNNLKDCLKILYYSWKKGLKNREIADMLKLGDTAISTDVSRRVTVIQQNCIKKAWRNVPLLEEVRSEYHIKQRNKQVWQ